MYTASTTAVPQNRTTRGENISPDLTYSHVVENTAFFGDVALRFPRIVHHYYDRNEDWDGMLRWGPELLQPVGGLHRRSPPTCPHADVTGAGNYREIPRLYKPVSHRERRRE
ncbi:hypothetical protein KUCAC02_007339 [Chaenocephalus aceratus]|uniref:Uncharacterized protein n=1 Tax=Chaenocephalus aceratus TaxID=36190 RepID=A0ACB9X6T0_CHAAC|nr:hypothetical protein KUCAC02_007339 [Chaenocephalus aceratus]